MIGLRYTLTSLVFLLIGFLLAPVIVHLSSKDVIHSSALPQMRVKQDAIPGIEQRLWFTPTRTGEWEINCSWLCSLGHYRMRGFYTIQTQADVDAWLASQPAGL